MTPETPTPTQTETVVAALHEMLSAPTDSHQMAAFLKDPDGRLVFISSRLEPAIDPISESRRLHAFCLDGGLNLFMQYLKMVETEGGIAKPSSRLVLP